MKKLYLIAETFLSEVLSRYYSTDDFFSIFFSSKGIGKLDTKSLLEKARASESFGKRQEYGINRLRKLLSEVKPKVVFYEMYEHLKILKEFGYEGKMILLDENYEPIKPILDVEKKMYDSEIRAANLSNRFKLLSKSNLPEDEKIKRANKLVPEMIRISREWDVIGDEYDRVVSQIPVNERERREFWVREIMRLYKKPSFMIYAPCNFNKKEEFTLEPLPLILIENGFELIF